MQCWYRKRKCLISVALGCDWSACFAPLHPHVKEETYRELATGGQAEVRDVRQKPRRPPADRQTVGTADRPAVGVSPLTRPDSFRAGSCHSERADRLRFGVFDLLAWGWCLKLLLPLFAFWSPVVSDGPFGLRPLQYLTMPFKNRPARCSPTLLWSSWGFVFLLLLVNLIEQPEEGNFLSFFFFGLSQEIRGWRFIVRPITHCSHWRSLSICKI